MTDMLRDYLIMDGAEEPADEFEYFAAIQRQINNGNVWLMQGSCGRAAHSAIESGACMCGTERRRDYWGHTIPARTDLQPGTKGTEGFVAQHRGEAWAERMSMLDATAAVAA